MVGNDLTVEAAEVIGRAFAQMLTDRALPLTVAVGRDNRPNGKGLHDALLRGLVESGCHVFDLGVVPTPLLYWSLHHLPVAAGIQITGSHNPPEFNGFKLCVGEGSVYGDALQKLRAACDAGKFPSGVGSVRAEQVIERYEADVVARIGKLSRPLKVVLDCGNGVAGLVAPHLFPQLGITPTILFAESDGTFPNHHPDPTVVENVQDLIAEVRRQGADIGIGFDGDADRIGIVDKSGSIIWGDYLLIVYARDVLTRTAAAKPGQSIIFDVKCSQALPAAITAAGGTPVMWKTGHSLIEEKMKEMDAPLAGEMSGHMFFKEGWYGFDDAIYGAARLLRIIADSGKRIDELLADVPRYVSTPEIRIDCPDDKKFFVVAAAIKHFKTLRQVIDVDGARIQYDDGWGLIRASNTGPILVLRFEARSQSRLDEIRADVAGWLATQGVVLKHD